MRIRSIITGILVLLTTSLSPGVHASDLASQTTEPTRKGLSKTFSDNTLSSTVDPAVNLEFDASLEYLGGQKFVLYGVAGVEQHFLVKTDPQGKLRSLYWIHFEEYLPGVEYTYDYSDAPQQTVLGQLDFATYPGVMTDFDPHSTAGKGTDFYATRQFLASKGYFLPTDWISTKLVHITDDTLKKELMMIVITDIDEFDVGDSDLKAIHSEAELQQKLQQTHIEQIKKSLALMSFRN